MTEFGPTGQLVYERTYSRTKPDGTKETWPETVARVVDGNLALVPERHKLPDERERLVELMERFAVLPAGRHLWASGVRGRQYLFNCHVSGWGENPWDHFEFTFLRLMEGGGVGANYSNRYLEQYPAVHPGGFQVHIVCDPNHQDYEKLLDAGVLSADYDAIWEGSHDVEDSREGWAAALTDLLGTYYRDAKNGNRVFDVSRVRSEGSRLKTFGGWASGPLPLAVMLHEVAEVMNRHSGYKLSGIGAMEIDHAIAKCVVSGGNRRSARMAIMHWDDPQIFEFLSCKSDTDKHWTTNISVEVDDEFWTALNRVNEVVKNDPNNAVNVKTYNILVAIAEGMLANGEPGFWDSSLSNSGEPNEVIATNPCGEIALEPWENCNLGHVNLAAFVDDRGLIEYDELSDAHELMTRFLMRATYGDVNDSKQSETLARNRRIGVGHLGVASFLAMTDIKYSEAPSDRFFTGLLRDLASRVDFAAEEYAHELRIPVPVKKRTVAPTGTIAKMPGVSEGIHPIFSKYFIRRVRFSDVDPDQFQMAASYAAQGYKVEPCQYAPATTVVEIPTKDSLMAEVEARFGSDAEDIVESAADLSLEQMLEFQAMYQAYWADNAVSYTANVDPGKYQVYKLAGTLSSFGGRLKGATVFPEMSRPQAPYERISKEQYEEFEAKQISDGIDEDCATGACPVR
ncbi:ribonucleoside-triphosphate reductase, adenosylcobalamin-dependent [Saccharopolyspora pogona]|uniref:ribonucleoside-triphosphate reductase, adenosylcobalamin-dependent n=1 Tax=Saccharopolyspora pogona TaxID=333966 RepID=UPI00168A058B|nr:ribonucleoside-triphosphate reductase, adenosylcobalamin-dependent [Saccharopolyspora pogona]